MVVRIAWKWQKYLMTLSCTLKNGYDVTFWVFFYPNLETVVLHWPPHHLSVASGYCPGQHRTDNSHHHRSFSWMLFSQRRAAGVQAGGGRAWQWVEVAPARVMHSAAQCTPDTWHNCIDCTQAVEASCELELDKLWLKLPLCFRGCCFHFQNHHCYHQGAQQPSLGSSHPPHCVWKALKSWPWTLHHRQTSVAWVLSRIEATFEHTFTKRGTQPINRRMWWTSRRYKTGEHGDRSPLVQKPFAPLLHWPYDIQWLSACVYGPAYLQGRDCLWFVLKAHVSRHRVQRSPSDCAVVLEDGPTLPFRMQ